MIDSLANNVAVKGNVVHADYTDGDIYSDWRFNLNYVTVS